MVYAQKICIWSVILCQGSTFLKNPEVLEFKDRSSSVRMFFDDKDDTKNIPLSDIWLNAPELILKNGYPFECHSNITTKDGYLLTAHRIPSRGSPVVLMFHGMFQTSRDFLMNQKHRAPAYKMAEAGYDIWLVNVRGNSYSRGHLWLKIDNPDYWNFSIDEVIKFDAPALIDYILKVTGESKVNWIGYSLGTAVGMGLTSTQSEYNQKIENLILLGTTAYVGNTTSPVLRLMSPFAGLLDTLITALNHGEVIPIVLFPIMRTVFPFLCLPEAKSNMPGICSLILFLIAGFDANQRNLEMLPVMLGGTPGSLAVKMLAQWFQWINGGKFSYFDFGKEINIIKYGTPLPPNYELRNVRTRVVNLYSDNDWLAVPQDVLRVVKDLPNVAFNIRVKLDKWNHLDFIYGKDADVFVYEEIISAIKMLSNNS